MWQDKANDLEQSGVLLAAECRQTRHSLVPQWDQQILMERIKKWMNELVMASMTLC